MYGYTTFFFFFSILEGQVAALVLEYYKAGFCKHLATCLCMDEAFHFPWANV